MKKLEPTVGLAGTVAIGVSAMLGGYFVIPGLAAAKTGPSVWLAFLVAAIAVLPAALSKAELATAMPASGGTYIYLARAFGPLAGTISGLGLWMSLLLKSAFALVGFAAYLSVIAPNIDVRFAALTLLVAITVLNVLGVSKIGKAQVIVVSLSILALGTLVVMGVDQFEPTHFDNSFTHGTGGFLSATAFVFVSFSGVTKVAALAEEVKRPERNLPLAMFFSLLIATTVYVAVTYALMAVVPMEQVAGSEMPIYLLGDAVGGKAVGYVAAGFAILTMVAMATAGLLASSRFPFAMSRDRLVPSALSEIHDTFKTPVNCIIMTAILMGLAILFLDIGPIAKLASAFKLTIFMCVNLTVIALRESRVEWYKPNFRSPLYPWVQIFGLVTNLLLLLALDLSAAMAAVGMAGLGVGLYMIYGRKHSGQRGVLSKLGVRKELLVEARSKTTLEMRRLAQTTEARALVAVDDTVRAPETLAELASVLAEGRGTRVIHVTEVPEQILDLDAVEEDAKVTSLRRRVHAMAESRDSNIEFDAVVTHDTVATIHRAASELGPQWAVIEWNGRRRRDVFLRNPRLWLHRHMPCNLALFHDEGVRYIREILVYPEPGPDDALVARTADCLAEAYGASLTYACFVPDDAPDSQVKQQTDYLDQVRRLSRRDSATLVVRGKKFVNDMSAVTARYDLLLTGAPLERGLKALFETPNDGLTEQAACSVLRVQTPHETTHEPLDVSVAAGFDFTRHVEERCIDPRLDISTKSVMFNHIAESFAKLTGLQQPDILEALWARERTQNTSVGQGVALPHATVRGFTGSVLGVFTTARPLDYQAPDQQEIDVFFVTMGPPSDRETHLMLLAQVSKLIRETPLVDELRQVQGRSDVVESLTRNLAKLDG